MPSYDQLAGSLNLQLVRGDDFSAMLDFSIPLTAHTVTSSLTSLVTGNEVVPFSVAFVSTTAGQVNVSLSDAQTLALARGTYGWNLKWTEGNATRTAISGFVEVS